VASALRNRPTDLTQLSRHNHGRYPDTHVVSVLQFGPNHRIFGSEEMPAWDSILGKMDQRPENLLRISNLSRYLKTMQDR
jgi:hypothetical protein